MPRQDLERNLAVDGRLIGAINRGHTPATEGANDPISTEVSSR